MAEAPMNLEKCIRRHDGFLVPILQDIQEHYHYLPEEVLKEVADKLKLPLRDVYGVATFYRSFSLTPKGKHIITVCLGTACHVRGGERIVEIISRELGIRAGDTTEDLKFTLETVNCLGACALGPIVVIDSEYHGQMTTAKAARFLKELRGSEWGKEDE
ncbi:MAG TPA: NADH-quinone oxidoreductase subunit NuoE [Dehalococcoidia bacterium]|nr:NADH-quinone oxidoreductase subunit NuoE [Dehalococcoidia bacterium]